MIDRLLSKENVICRLETILDYTKTNNAQRFKTLEYLKNLVELIEE